MSERAICELCGDPMPEGEEMFKFHGYSGPCPKPPKSDVPESNALKNFHADILAAIKKKGLTQRDLAEEAGVSQAYVSYILSGKRSLSPRVAVACESLLDLDADLLVRQQSDWRLEKLLAEVKSLRP